MGDSCSRSFLSYPGDACGRRRVPVGRDGITCDRGSGPTTDAYRLRHRGIAVLVAQAGHLDVTNQDEITNHPKWARAVKSRDGFKCQKCDSTNHLHAHHIEHRRNRPDLALVVDNGVTLCDECHADAHENNPTVARAIRLLKSRKRASGPRGPVRKAEEIVEYPSMQASDLEDWITSRGLGYRGKATAAKELDISINRLNRFLDGSVRIPKHIGLACSAISFPLPPWRAVLSIGG